MINEISLDVTVPETGLYVSCMHPFIELVAIEPYTWQLNKRGQQLDRISRFMNVAKQFGSNKKSHFTITPEYSIQGLYGIESVNQFLLDATWPSETVVIGGVDGLSKDEKYKIQQNTRKKIQKYKTLLITLRNYLS